MPDDIPKVVLFGATRVGKTSIIASLLDHSDPAMNRLSTISAHCDKLCVDNKHVCNLWDTAGQEQFQSLTPMYYRASDIGLAVFDLSDMETLTTLKSYTAIFQQYARSTSSIIVIGNKYDLCDQATHNIQNSGGKLWADDNNFTYLETSALTGFQIDELRDLICDQLSKRPVIYNDGELPITSNKSGQQSSCC